MSDDQRGIPLDADPGTAAAWDVVVIGAGPAGSMAARALAERGHTVLIVDRAAFPREKVCGDGLIPDALQCLRRAGLYEPVAARGHRLGTLSVFSPSGVRVDLPGDFVTLPRLELDSLLLQDAQRLGAVFRTARVTSVASCEEGVLVSVAGDAPPVHARYAIVATGADQSLASWDGVADPRRSDADAVAVRCYVESPAAVDELVISFDRHVLPGYAWIFPLGNGRYNIGCGIFRQHERHGKVNLRHTFAAFTERFPLARTLWTARTGATRLAGAMLRCGLQLRRAWDGHRVVAAGEAIATTYPFTGEGIGKAMESGEAAARHVAAALAGEDHALAGYAEALRRQFLPRYSGYRIAENWISSPWVSDVVARGVRRSSRLRRAAAGVISETADPRAVFSVRALAAGLLPQRRAK